MLFLDNYNMELTNIQLVVPSHLWHVQDKPSSICTCCMAGIVLHRSWMFVLCHTHSRNSSYFKLRHSQYDIHDSTVQLKVGIFPCVDLVTNYMLQSKHMYHKLMTKRQELLYNCTATMKQLNNKLYYEKKYSYNCFVMTMHCWWY